MAITNRDMFGFTGVPHRYSDTIEADLEAIFTGDVPARSGIDFPVAPNQSILALTVVGLNREGRVVPAQFSPESRTAQGTVTLNGNPANNASLTVGGIAYEVKDNPASTRHAQRGGDQATTVDALIAVINSDPSGAAFAFLESNNLIRLTARSPGAHGNVAVAVAGGGFQAEQDLTGGTGGVVPIGVMAYTIETGAGETPSQGVYVSGVFNPDRLIWDASFSNDALKKIAFANAPAFSRCLLRKIRANTV